MDANCDNMEPVNKFMLAVAIIWTLFAGYAFALLLPFMNRRLREWDAKFKRNSTLPAMPNVPQRVVFLLLTSLMTTVSLASAFHRDLTTLLGVPAWTLVALMICLPILYFMLGRWGKSHWHSKQPNR
jgi:hypothetical protein